MSTYWEALRWNDKLLEATELVLSVILLLLIPLLSHHIHVTRKQSNLSSPEATEATEAKTPQGGGRALSEHR